MTFLVRTFVIAAMTLSFGGGLARADDGEQQSSSANCTSVCTTAYQVRLSACEAVNQEAMSLCMASAQSNLGACNRNCTADGGAAKASEAADSSGDNHDDDSH